jgi:hypothetical protein
MGVLQQTTEHTTDVRKQQVTTGGPIEALAASEHVIQTDHEPHEERHMQAIRKNRLKWVRTTDTNQTRSNQKGVIQVMISPGKKLAFVAMSVIAATFGTVAMAGASVAPGTQVTGTSKSVTFKGTINGIQVTVSCTNFTDTATVTAGANKSIDIPAPTITGCTDTLTGTDTIKTNDKNGSWELKTNGKGNKLKLVIPKAGATFTSSFLPSCTITAAPTAAVSVKGTYSSSAGTDTATNAPIAVKGTGCTATSSSVTVTVTFSPNPGTIPPFAS